MDGGDGDPILSLGGVVSFRAPSSRGARGQGSAENLHQIIKNPTEWASSLCSSTPSPKAFNVRAPQASPFHGPSGRAEFAYKG